VCAAMHPEKARHARMYVPCGCAAFPGARPAVSGTRAVQRTCACGTLRWAESESRDARTAVRPSAEPAPRTGAARAREARAAESLCTLSPTRRLTTAVAD
jgi:hypothetical protein